MNRQTRALVVVGLAIVLASLASFGAYRAIQQLPVREIPVATTFAVVAREPLGTGTVIAPQQVQLIAWPEAAPVQGGFATIEEVVGRGLVSSVVPNEPITESKLAPREAGGGLPPLITPGMRAMSVRVNDVIGVAGFVRESTRVDLLVTMRAGGQQESMSRVVVSNVLVLTANTQYDQQKGREGTAVPSTVVTLLVTPQDAERIALAQNDGQIMLALRNPLDVEATKTTGVRVSGLFGSPNPAPVTRVVQGRPRVETPPPPPAPYTVEAIRGAQRSREVIK